MNIISILKNIFKIILNNPLGFHFILEFKIQFSSD